MLTRFVPSARTVVLALIIAAMFILLFPSPSVGPCDPSIQRGHGIPAQLSLMYATSDNCPSDHFGGMAAEGTQLILQCAGSGKFISAVDFASFGNPKGHCGNFQIGDCHNPNVSDIVVQQCVGKPACILQATSALFGDACNQAPRKLAVRVRGCEPAVPRAAVPPSPPNSLSPPPPPRPAEKVSEHPFEESGVAATFEWAMSLTGWKDVDHPIPARDGGPPNGNRIYRFLKAGAKVAYVWYATDPRYACHAVVARRQLQLMSPPVDPTIHMVILVPPGTNGGTLTMLERNFDKVIKMEPEYYTSHGYYRSCMLKLRIFQLKEYDRVVLFDSDGFPTQNTDHLFQLPPCLVWGPTSYWLRSENPGGDAGDIRGDVLSSSLVMVDPTNPLAETGVRMIKEFYAAGGSLNGRPLMDMDVLNLWDKFKNEGCRLPTSYCMLSDDCFLDKPLQQTMQKITRGFYVHFTEGGKPFDTHTTYHSWEQHAGRLNLPPGRTLIWRLIHWRFHKLACKFCQAAVDSDRCFANGASSPN